MKSVIMKCGCNLPWSTFQIDKFKNCSDSKDFMKYLNVLKSLQEDIETLPKKCKHDSWTSSLLTEQNPKSKTTGIILVLLLKSKKVKAN